jgi:hypothetical protein
MKPKNALFSASFLLIACNPYQRFVGEFNAGPVNPVSFPAAYLGVDGSARFGGGHFAPLLAHVGDEIVPYYLFPAGGAQAEADNPRAIANVPAPLAYVFDPPGEGGASLVDSQHCIPPKGYLYDQQRDDVRYDQQGDLFTALPGKSYTPVVAEVAVHTRDLPCQSIKTTDTVVTSKHVELQSKLPAIAGPDTKPVGIPDGRYLARAIIDPSAHVAPTDAATGLGPQSYGWYQHYLVVYLDGGYIPTSADGSELVAQTLYVPTLVPATDDAGNPTIVANSDPGSGLDLLEARRGDASYSPFCRISLYTPPFPGVPLLSSDASQTTATDRYVYCLQTR